MRTFMIIRSCLFAFACSIQRYIYVCRYEKSKHKNKKRTTRCNVIQSVSCTAAAQMHACALRTHIHTPHIFRSMIVCIGSEYSNIRLQPNSITYLFIYVYEGSTLPTKSSHKYSNKRLSHLLVRLKCKQKFVN